MHVFPVWRLSSWAFYVIYPYWWAWLFCNKCSCFLEAGDFKYYKPLCLCPLAFASLANRERMLVVPPALCPSHICAGARPLNQNLWKSADFEGGRRSGVIVKNRLGISVVVMQQIKMKGHRPGDFPVQLEKNLPGIYQASEGHLQMPCRRTVSRTQCHFLITWLSISLWHIFPLHTAAYLLDRIHDSNPLSRLEQARHS